MNMFLSALIAYIVIFTDSTCLTITILMAFPLQWLFPVAAIINVRPL